MVEFFTAIGNFGFPIVVAGYLLFRFENKIEKLNDSISGREGLITQISTLKRSVNQLSQKVDKLARK